MLKYYIGLILSTDAQGLLWREHFQDGTDETDCARSSAAQSEKYKPGNSAEFADCNYRSVWFGKIFPGLRHNLCRRAAQVRGIALCIRAAIPGSDGAPGRRRD